LCSHSFHVSHVFTCLTRLNTYYTKRNTFYSWSNALHCLDTDFVQPFIPKLGGGGGTGFGGDDGEDCGRNNTELGGGGSSGGDGDADGNGGIVEPLPMLVWYRPRVSGSSPAPRAAHR
jgi:hypothetical protein